MSIKASMFVFALAGLLLAVEPKPVPPPPTVKSLQKELATANARIAVMKVNLQYLQLREASHAALDRSRQVEQVLLDKYDAGYKEQIGPLEEALKKAEAAELVDVRAHETVTVTKEKK